jgi:hypothetical protein
MNIERLLDIETALIERRFFISGHSLTAISITTEIECDDTCGPHIAFSSRELFSSQVTTGTGTLHNDL